MLSRALSETMIEKVIKYSLLLFLVCALPSIFFAYDKSAAVVGYGKWLIGISIFFASYKTAVQKRHECYVKWFIGLLVLVSIAILIKEFYQYFILHISRPRSIVGNPNTAAEYFELIIPIVLAYSIKQKRLVNKSITIVFLFILLLGLLITLTRAAIILTAVGIIFILLISRKYKIAVTTLIIYGGFLSYISNNDYFNRIITVADIYCSSSMERIYIWTSSFHMLKDYWTSGLGFGNFKYVYSLYMNPDAKEQVIHAHNIFLSIGTEAGITALFFIIIFFVGSIFYLLRACFKPDVIRRSWEIGFICGSIMLLIHSLIDYPFYKEALLWCIMFELGISFGFISSRYRDITVKRVI